jgi:Secretion system C-terminal sorting domain
MTIPSGALLNNTLYFWRVRSQNAAGNGPWSAIFRFRTIVALPNAPGLLLPVNGASNVPLNPLFDWDSNSTATFYRLQAALDTSFTNPPVDITNITQSFLNLVTPPLQNNFRYYWRVSATNIAGTGPWSAVFSFTTVLGLPSAPAHLAPPNNSTGISLTPLLDWVDDISATSYRLQLSEDSTFVAQSILDTTGFSVSSVTVRSGLLTNVRSYFWRVRTTNPIGTGPFSVPWKFTTLLAPPVQPILVSPLNNSTNISTTPTLDWDSVPYAASYRVQISTDPAFGNTITNISGLTASQYNVPGGTLENNTLYYWRVNATNTAGTGPYSAVWNFRTVISPPVAAPNLISPPNGATNQSATPTLDWNDVFGTNGYRLQVSSDSLFNLEPVLDTTIVPSQFTVPAGILVGNTFYYWRVRGFNVGGFGPWSVTWRFRTGPISINPIGTEIPTEFRLYGNYPNPFNPSTNIRFDIPQSDRVMLSYVRLSVFDITGKEIAVLVNERLSPGKYELLWDGSSFASGIYFYRLLAGEHTGISKMILLK